MKQLLDLRELILQFVREELEKKIPNCRIDEDDHILSVLDQRIIKPGAPGTGKAVIDIRMPSKRGDLSRINAHVVDLWAECLSNYCDNYYGNIYHKTYSRQFDPFDEWSLFCATYEIIREITN